MPLLDHSGVAVSSQLATGIASGALTFDLTNATGWPTGGANGKFYVTFNRGGANEERILVASRSGVTCTIASAGDRGKDGTSAAAHTANETIEHTFAAEEAHDYNQHLYNVARDDHTQYMLAAGTRHDLTARHQAGTTIPTAAPVAVVANQAGAEGTGGNLARATHVHAGPITAAPVSVGTANAAGSGTNIALANHVHDIGAAAIDDVSLFAASLRPEFIGAAAPSSPVTGQLWWDSDLAGGGGLFVWNGSAWIYLIGSQQPQYAARAFASGSTNLLGNATTQVVLAGETYDYGNNFASNAYTAPVTGLYECYGRVEAEGNNSPQGLTANLAVNGSGVSQGVELLDRGSNALDHYASVVADRIVVTAGQAITLTATNVGGNQIAVITGTTATYLSVNRVS